MPAAVPNALLQMVNGSARDQTPAGPLAAVRIRPQGGTPRASDAPLPATKPVPVVHRPLVPGQSLKPSSPGAAVVAPRAGAESKKVAEKFAAALGAVPSVPASVGSAAPLAPAAAVRVPASDSAGTSRGRAGAPEGLPAVVGSGPVPGVSPRAVVGGAKPGEVPRMAVPTVKSGPAPHSMGLGARSQLAGDRPVANGSSGQGPKAESEPSARSQSPPKPPLPGKSGTPAAAGPGEPPTAAAAVPRTSAFITPEAQAASGTPEPPGELAAADASARPGRPGAPKTSRSPSFGTWAPDAVPGGAASRAGGPEAVDSSAVGAPEITPGRGVDLAEAVAGDVKSAIESGSHSGRSAGVATSETSSNFEFGTAGCAHSCLSCVQIS